MANFKKQLPLIVVIILATAFLGAIINNGQTKEGVGGGGGGFTGTVAVQDLIGTKSVPTQGATSTSAQESGCDGCRKTTSTEVIFLENADTVTLGFQMDATTTDSSLGWYFETSNAADCQVDGPWAIRTTSTEMLGADFQQSPGNTTPTDSLTPGVKGRMVWEQTISGINASCLKLTTYFASSTDDSSIWVSASLK
ncbi:MAG: hypothetical protein CL944_01875 [Candidatus Diapherotrites archaeon]|uniref:Uncharacterized protein n=1 Tax=Candidatus Iainarchaeum sp. TaxID=3101447 RepID=A0A2D6LPV7_9ARCH|nr:hypothetical protein [Candidatus Diapherotrites archaeon]|tara:strand:- start:315 stop:902 length:588 start_codon:yes stop_codon:yes gene_type:complete